MFRLKLIPDNPSFIFLNYFKIGFIFSVVLIVLSISSFLFQGLNLGIDFKGGTLIEAKSKSGKADVQLLRNKLQGNSFGEVSIQLFGGEDEVLIRIQKQEGDEQAQIKVIKEVISLISDKYTVRRTEFVGPTIGAELTQKGILAVITALIAIMIYIWFRFEWQFAVSAILALFHDVIATIGLFAFTGLEFNLSTVAAVLTIAGYSVNDTVVVFDRVRENLRKTKSSDQLSIINKSLNETLSRTITTSVTTLLALLAIYFVGGEVISDFTLAMIWGVMIGTYSSIFVASAFLTFFNLRRTREEEAEDLNYFNNE